MQKIRRAAQNMAGHVENTSRSTNNGKSCRKCVGTCLAMAGVSESSLEPFVSLTKMIVARRQWLT